MGERHLSGRIIDQFEATLDGGDDFQIVGFGVKDALAERRSAAVQEFQQRHPRVTAGVREAGIIMLDRGEDVDERNVLIDHPPPSLAWELDKERNSQGRVVEGRTVIEELVMVIKFFTMVRGDDDQPKVVVVKKGGRHSFRDLAPGELQKLGVRFKELFFFF